MKKRILSLDDYIFEMTNTNEVRIEFKMRLPNTIMELFSIFKKNKFQLYVVGGAVRDSYMKSKPKDYDLATNATPDEILAILNNKYKTIETGKSFGVINVFIGNEEYEIATFRSDIGSGRRPTSVKFTTIENDVKRRDLTINSLFYDIENEEIVDLVGGISDIDNNIIRTVGDPATRFDEDPLRKLRAIRFAARVGSSLHKETSLALVQKNELDNVSKERIRDEFLKGIHSAKNVIHFLRMIQEYNMFIYIFPSLQIETKHFINNKNEIILIANILQTNKISEIEDVLYDARYTSKEVNDIVCLVLLHDLNEDTVSHIKKRYKKLGFNFKYAEEYAKINNISKNKILAFRDTLEFNVSGNELMKRGLNGIEIRNEIDKQTREYFMNKL